MEDFGRTNKVKKFGMKVRLERTKRRLTQETLAELAKISPSALGKIERGESTPNIDTMYALADALQISPSELVDINKFDF